ncbi:unnamed protein product [Caretta caretta]
MPSGGSSPRHNGILYSGEVSLWDLDDCSVMSVFTPDSKISCLTVALDRKTILVGMSDSPALILKKIECQSHCEFY